MTDKEQIVTAENRSLHEVVADYSYALDLLDQYDYRTIEVEAVSGPPRFRATYEGAMEAIRSLKERFGGSPLFGNEKDGSFRSSIGQIYQTFDGRELYGLLYRTDGSKRIADNTLVALTLMIACSPAEEKDLMVRLAVCLINVNNE